VKKMILFLLTFLISCSAQKSSIPFDIVSEKLVIAHFNECIQCSDFKEAFYNPGDMRDLKKVNYQGKTYII